MTDFTLELLKAEIENDPLGLGYAPGAVWLGDQEIADLMNAANYTVNRSTVDTGDIRGNVTFDAFDGLVTAEQAWLEWLTANGVIPVTDDTLQQLAGVPTANGSVWAVAERTEMNAAMELLMQFQGGRAEVLWGGGTTISAGQVGAAANV